MAGIENNTSFPDLAIVDPRLQLKQIEYDNITYVCPTWDQMGIFNFDLAKQIIQSGKSFDRIVALARGGWTWARDLADGLKIQKLSSLGIKSYSGVNQSGKPQIVQPLADSIVGENILLFDEVIDSGSTIKVAKKYLSIMGARNIQTAALCCKPRTEIRPNYYAFSTGAWVVFPHEIREFMEISVTKWLADKITISEAKNRLATIGIPQDQVDFYFKLIT